jgi:hypothetical protein
MILYCTVSFAMRARQMQRIRSSALCLRFLLERLRWQKGLILVKYYRIAIPFAKQE